MANLIKTNVDVGNFQLGDNAFKDDTYVFTGALTIEEGTILARLTASEQLVPFVIGGSLGAEIPVGIATEQIIVTGAGTPPTRILISGKVRKERLIVQADGDDSNIDQIVRDELQQAGIQAINVKELQILDN